MKVFILPALLFILGLPAHAQSDVETGVLRTRFSAGLYSTKDIHNNLNYSSAPGWGKHSTGTYFLDLSFYRQNLIELGLGFGYQKPKVMRESLVFENVYVEDPNMDVAYYTILPQVRFNWIGSEELFELYSTIGMGLTIVDVNRLQTNAPPDETFPLPAFNFTWVGMRFGDKFGGFIELGLGTKGLLAAGISLRY